MRRADTLELKESGVDRSNPLQHRNPKTTNKSEERFAPNRSESEDHASTCSPYKQTKPMKRLQATAAGFFKLNTLDKHQPKKAKDISSNVISSPNNFSVQAARILPFKINSKSPQTLPSKNYDGGLSEEQPQLPH